MWYENGEKHRDGGAAVERADGSSEWWVRGKKHRMGGPAIVEEDGSEEWWVDGEKINASVAKKAAMAMEKKARLHRLAQMELEMPEKVTF